MKRPAEVLYNSECSYITDFYFLCSTRILRNPLKLVCVQTSPASFVAKLVKRNTLRRELIQLTSLSFVVTAQRSKTH